jgi:hypothetical protein
MTEERKHAILFAATLLSARRLIESIHLDKPDMAEAYFVDRAIKAAEFILEQSGSGEVILFRGEPRSCDGISRRGPTALSQAEEGCSALALLLPQLLSPD